VIVFNDGQLNLIRLQQLGEFGRSSAVELENPDFELFAQAVGARYTRIDGNADSVFRTAIESDDVWLIEVLVGDSPAIRALQAKGWGKAVARRTLGPKGIRALKRFLRRGQ
jgi:thiamine pyrophosphate-dependent acetolactate synthase large subunit-like protein